MTMESNDELFPEVLPAASTTLVTAETVSTNLAAVRAAAENFDAIAKSVLALEQQHPKALQLDLKVEANMAIAKAAYGAWREKRLALERSRKAAKAPVLALGRAVDGYAGQLEDSLRAGENNYKLQIEAREAEIARQEQERVERHEKGIATIRGFLEKAKGLQAARIQLGIDRLREMKFGEDWEEYANKAYTAQQETLKALEQLLAETKNAELLESERQRQREEQEAEKKRLDAEQQRLAEQRAALDAQTAALAKQQTAMGDMQMMQQHVQAARECQTLEEIQQLADGLAQWPVNEDLFGTAVPVVQMTKDAALLQVRELYRVKEAELAEAGRAAAAREAEERAAAQALQSAAPPAAAPIADPFGPAPEPAPSTKLNPSPAWDFPGHEDRPAPPPPLATFDLPASMRAPAQLPPAGQPGEEATLNIGTMVERLGFQITAAFVIETLGIQPRHVERRAQLYYPSDWRRICDALVKHIGTVRDIPF